MKKLLLTLLLILALNALWVTPVLGATDANVTVTYTVEYLAITDNATTVAFGTIATSATPTTATSYIAITNDSSVQVDATIGAVNPTWTGGTAHTHSDTATPGADIVGLKASRGTGAFDVIVKNAAAWNYIYENAAAGADWTYELKLYAPTSTSDGVEKTNTVRTTIASG